MELFAAQVLNGLVSGSVYSLVALGLTLIYGTMQVPNFAHGHLYMLGAYVTFSMVTLTGLHYWTATVAAMLVVALVGVALERLVFRPLRHAPHLNSMIAAIGVMLVLEGVAQRIWGEDFRRMASPYDTVVSLAGLPVSAHRVILIGAAVLLMASLLLFLTRTTAGLAIRAAAQDREGALLVGIQIDRVTMGTFALSAAIASIAGSLIAPVSLIYPAMGALVTLKAFVIVVLGGMGSVTGALAGGYMLALAESLGGTYVSADYQDVVAFLVLVLVFAFRPSGLFREAP
jgi:branched-chain amino acid transport system permease protein